MERDQKMRVLFYLFKMGRIYAYALMAAVCFNYCPAGASGTETPDVVLRVSLEEAISGALETMEDIRISKAETEVSYHKYRETQTARYPYLSGHAQWLNNNRYPLNVRYPGGTFEDYETGAGLTLRQVVCSFGMIPAAVEAAGKNLEMSRWNEKVKKEDVIYNARFSYYTAVFARKARDIVRESYNNSLENKAILENRSAMGRVSRKDNIKIQADIASRIPLLTNAEADLISSLNTLKRVMGLDFDME
ncbi:MAG: TolC family protein, partial [Candidatus Omnitrophota bacterium]